MSRGNIYVGFQGIGKSSIAGGNNIDLESSNFFYGGYRFDAWEEVYVNIAKHLAEQGFNVFLSAHKQVRGALAKRGINYVVICPSLQIKEQWLARLAERMQQNPCDKNYKALSYAEQHYDEAVADLLQERNVIIIDNINYDLNEVVKRNKDE